jgi:hypothetical protein
MYVQQWVASKGMAWWEYAPLAMFFHAAAGRA